MTRIGTQFCAAVAFSAALQVAASPAFACTKIPGFKPVCLQIAPDVLDEIKMLVQQYSNQNSFQNTGLKAPNKNCVTIDNNKTCGFSSDQLNDIKNLVVQSKSNK